MDLLPHNKKAYDAVIDAFQSSHYTCVIHPTGSGKSYIALQLIEDHPEATILYVTSYAMNLDEFKEKVKKFLTGNKSIVDNTDSNTCNDTDYNADSDNDDSVKNETGANVTYSIYKNLTPDAYPKFDYIIPDEFVRL